MGCIFSRQAEYILADSVETSTEQLNRSQNREREPDFYYNYGKYAHQKVIGKGGFGFVVQARDCETGAEFAIKIEEYWSVASEIEFLMYKKLEGLPTIPKLYENWDEKHCTLLRMELLGINLFDFANKFEHGLKAVEVHQIASQMIGIMETVHERGIVHCDVKPANFAFGTGDNTKKLYIIDFGLSEMYLDKNGNHTDKLFRDNAKGTAMYMSSNQHVNLRNTRRDDLESIVYTCMELCKIKTSWDSTCYVGNADHAELYDSKMNYTPPIYEFRKMLEMCRKLEFNEKPNYKEMQNLFDRHKIPDLGKYLHSHQEILKYLNHDQMKLLRRFSPIPPAG